MDDMVDSTYYYIGAGWEVLCTLYDYTGQSHTLPWSEIHYHMRVNGWLARCPMCLNQMNEGIHAYQGGCEPSNWVFVG